MRCLSLLFLCSLLVLAGCAPAAPQSLAWDLVLAAPVGQAANAAQAAADAYAQATGLRVRVQAFPGDAYSDRVSAALLAGTGEFDLIYLSTESLPKWASYHVIQPLTLPEDASTAPWLPLVTVEGAAWGVPVQPDTDVLWYRADLFEQAGLDIPQDWQALESTASTLDLPPETAWLAVSGGDLDAGRDLAALLAGADWMEQAELGWRVDIDALRGALDRYARWADPDSPSRTRGDVQGLLASGQSALGILPLSAANALLDCERSLNACKDGKPLLTFAPLPGTAGAPGAASAQAWAIPLKAAHPQAAQGFSAWLASAEGARAWASGGGLPAHRAVLAEIGTPAAVALAQVEQFRPVFPPVIPAGDIWRALHIAGHGAAEGEPSMGLVEKMVRSMETALRQSGYTVVER